MEKYLIERKKQRTLEKKIDIAEITKSNLENGKRKNELQDEITMYRVKLTNCKPTKPKNDDFDPCYCKQKCLPRDKQPSTAERIRRRVNTYDTDDEEATAKPSKLLIFKHNQQRKADQHLLDEWTKCQCYVKDDRPKKVAFKGALSYSLENTMKKFENSAIIKAAQSLLINIPWMAAAVLLSDGIRNIQRQAI